MSDESKTLLDIDKTCRTCLTQKSTEELQPLIENNLKSTITEVTNVELTINASLPKCICKNCLTHLNIALDFRKQVHQAELQLRNILDKQSEHITVIYKTFAALGGATISNECIAANIGEINGLKDSTEDLLILECVNDDTEDGNSQSIANEDDSNIELETTNLNKSPTLTNVIKWADSETNLVSNKQNQPIQAENVKENSPKKVNFNCDLCSKKFRFEFIFKKHQLKHKIPLGCKDCSLLFHDINEYLRHIKSDHPEYKPFACPNCEARYNTLASLKTHFKFHTADSPKRLECDVCGKKFFQLNYLTNHKRSHTNLDPYKCQICKKQLAGSHSLLNHLKIHSQEKKFKCEICGANFIHRFSLRAHLRTHTGEKPFACKRCDNKFSSSSYLKIHMRIHTAEKPYACVTCPKSFVSKCALSAHEKSHSGEKKFQCEVCGWRSTRSADLQTHIRKHTGEKPYSCEQCGKSYKTASNLSAHRKTHSGLKEHICGTCHKAFGDPRTLKIHIRVHTGETPYQCHICGLSFKQSGQFAAHRRIHQPKEVMGNT